MGRATWTGLDGTARRWWSTVLWAAAVVLFRSAATVAATDVTIRWARSAIFSFFADAVSAIVSSAGSAKDLSTAALDESGPSTEAVPMPLSCATAIRITSAHGTATGFVEATGSIVNRAAVPGTAV